MSDMHAISCQFADKLITPLVLIAGVVVAMGILVTSAAAAHFLSLGAELPS